ncbi:MAG: hypothetical protein ACRDP1_04590 [Nocardioidaceae bacterium]
MTGDTDPRGIAHPVPVSASALDGDWVSEANVQAAVVAHLIEQDWQIMRTANTAINEHGIDVIATNGTRSVGVEVKGFPTAGYADPRRVGEVKKTQPSTQAGH